MTLAIQTASAGQIQNVGYTLSAGGELAVGVYDFRIQAKNVGSYLNHQAFFLSSASNELLVDVTAGNQTVNLTWDYLGTGYNYHCISYASTASLAAGSWYTASNVSKGNYYSLLATGSSQCSASISSSGQNQGAGQGYSYLNYPYKLPFNKFSGTSRIHVTGDHGVLTMTEVSAAIVAAGDSENFYYDGRRYCTGNYHWYFEDATGSFDMTNMLLEWYGNFFNQGTQFHINASNCDIAVCQYGGRWDPRNVSCSAVQVHGTMDRNPYQAYTIGANNYMYIYGSSSVIMEPYFKNCIVNGPTVQHYQGCTVSGTTVFGTLDLRHYGQTGGVDKMTIRDSEYNYILYISNYDCTNLNKTHNEFRNITFGKSFTSYDIRYYFNVKRGKLYDCKFFNGLVQNGSHNKPDISYFGAFTDQETWIYHELDLKVIDENGSAIEGANVTVTDETDTELWNVNTNAAGTASEDILFATASYVSAEVSNYLIKTNTLSVKKDGYETYAVVIYDPQDKQTLTITLKPSVQSFQTIDGKTAINLNPKNTKNNRGLIHIL